MNITLFNWEQLYQDRDYWESYMLPSIEDKELLGRHSYKGHNVLSMLLGAGSYAEVLELYDHSIREIISKRLTHLYLKQAGTMEAWRSVWLWYDTFPYSVIISKLEGLKQVSEDASDIEIIHKNSKDAVAKLPAGYLPVQDQFRTVCIKYFKLRDSNPRSRNILMQKYGILNMVTGKMVTPCIFSNVWDYFFSIGTAVYAMVSLSNKKFIIRAVDGAVVSELVDHNDFISVQQGKVVIFTGRDSFPSSISDVFTTPSNYKEVFSVEDLDKFSVIPGAVSYFKSRDWKKRPLEELTRIGVKQKEVISGLQALIEGFNPTIQDAESEVKASLLYETVRLGDKQFSYLELLKKENPDHFGSLVFNMQQPESFPKWKKYSKWVEDLKVYKDLDRNVTHCIEDYNIPEWGEGDSE